MNEFNEYVRDCFSEAGDIVLKSMMGGYLVYFKGKLIGDVCGDKALIQELLDGMYDELPEKKPKKAR